MEVSPRGGDVSDVGIKKPRVLPCLEGYIWNLETESCIDAADMWEQEICINSSFSSNPCLMDTWNSVQFGHIFAGGYAAGYYSYKWAEVLDADAFSLFQEQGVFDPETAKSFKENILSQGGTTHPMELYKKFRGKEPEPDALLKRAGLA